MNPLARGQLDLKDDQSSQKSYNDVGQEDASKSPRVVRLLLLLVLLVSPVGDEESGVELKGG